MPTDTRDMVIGSLEGRLQALDDRVDRMEREVREDLRLISDKIDRLTEAHAKMSGAKNVLGAIGLLVTSLVSSSATVLIELIMHRH